MTPDASDSSANPDSETPKSPTLDVVWHQFGEQLRRRARTGLRQYGLTGQAESMDICNDVMVDLARRQEAIGPGQNSLQVDDVLAYIMRAIDNQVMDAFRTLARQCRDFRRNDATPVDELRVPMHATTPSQVALRREVMTKIRAMLGPEDAKAVDMMLENRNWNEIGAALGLQADAARMRVRRAIDRVRDEIGIVGDDE